MKHNVFDQVKPYMRKAMVKAEVTQIHHITRLMIQESTEEGYIPEDRVSQLETLIQQLFNYTRE